MDFSELIKFSGPHGFSPDSTHLAAADKHRLFIRNAETLEIEHIFSCQEPITTVEWSPDSGCVMCVEEKSGTVEVWSLQPPGAACKIQLGVLGLLSARWAADSRHVLTVTDFQLRLTIWSLAQQRQWHIKMPKFADKCIEFSNNGRYLTVAERRDFKDLIGLYDTTSWELIKHFEVETEDLHDFQWSPSDRYICVWDSPLEYKILVYSPDGRKLMEHQAYTHTLGVRGVAWSTAGHFLAVGSFDQRARIFGDITWKKIAEFRHASPVTQSLVVVYSEVPADDVSALPAEPLNQATSPPASPQETVDSDAAFRAKLQSIQEKGQASIGQSGFISEKAASSFHQREPESVPQVPTKYVVAEVPYDVFQAKPETEKANPRQGVSVLAWSIGDKYLMTRNDNMPNALWIWETQRLTLGFVLNHTSPIRIARWDPRGERIALCTENGKLYLWTPQACSIVDIPAVNFAVRSLEWSSNGASIVLADKARFCCCYFQPAPSAAV